MDTIQLPFTDEIKKRLKEPKMLMQFIIGPRQVGKTTGIESILEDYPGPTHYLLVEDEPIRNLNWLQKQWWYTQSLGANALLVLNEIQKVTYWAEGLKALWDESKKKKKPLKCVFLGSSSLDLSRGTRESLAGRFEVIQVPHWDYTLSKKLITSFSFEAFLRQGGYPGSYAFLTNKERWHQYMKSSIIESVLTKDIFGANTIKKPVLFRQLIELLASYPAQEVSYTKLLGQLQESGNVEIIKHYLKLLENAFLFCGLEKYSPKKVLLKASSPKIIPMCPSLIEVLAPEVTFGRRFEAYIGSQLLKLNGEAYYWREGQYEVDFVYKNLTGQLFVIEVKSGKHKHSASLNKFLEKVPKAEVVIIDQNNMDRLQSLIE